MVEALDIAALYLSDIEKGSSKLSLSGVVNTPEMQNFPVTRDLTRNPGIVVKPWLNLLKFIDY